MIRKLSGLFFLFMLLAIPAWILFFSPPSQLLKSMRTPGAWLNNLESTLTNFFPASKRLRETHVMLTYYGGNKEQNGVFLSNEMLMSNVKPQDALTLEDNTNYLLGLAKVLDRPSYLMLIPTACAIKQDQVPYSKVAPLYPQREMIDEVYRNVSGSVTAIDVYPTLFNHQDEYIYYHTDSTPTGIGGYYIYATMAKKLGLSNVRGMEQFDATHLDYDYFGDLYQRSPYRRTQADRVTTYEFRYPRTYAVSHYDAQGMRTYYTLYPDFKQQLGDAMDVILGGVSPIVDVQVGNVQYNNKRLLLFGDRSMQSYLPFLLIHYGQVTFVDTEHVTPELLEQLNLEAYRQVLFAYSVEAFLNTRQFDVCSAWLASHES